jgi:putative endonuclease
MSFFVYLLLSSDNCTYVGATVDLDKRLRQHNKEIKGGAKYTSSKVSQGELWMRVAHVEGFPDWQSALQFEWRWKQLTRINKEKLKPLEKRIIALKKLLSLDRPTSKSKLYSEWDNPPKVILEDDETRNFFETL